MACLLQHKLQRGENMDITMPVKEITHTPIQAKKPVIKLLGLGGAGSNAINRML